MIAAAHRRADLGAGPGDRRGGLCASGLQALRLNRPAEPVNATVVRLRVPAQIYGTYAFALADGRTVYWRCEAASCAPSARSLQGLRWETPMPAEFLVASNQIVGLNIREAEVIDTDAEVGRRTAGQAAWLAGEAALAAIAGVGLYLHVRRRKAR